MNCIIIHGCPRDKEDLIDIRKNYAHHWIPWVRRKLEEKGIKISTPLMPEPWNPDYDRFKQEFEKEDINENTVLIGHSCGCAFLVNWLGETKQKIKKLILVAPWKINDGGEEYRKKFYDFPIDETVKERVGSIVMFTSDNEKEDGKKSLEIYHQAMGGKIIELKGYGHYIFDHMGGDEFPELVEEVIKQ